MNIFIRLAFFGKNYYGTQIQPDKKTIQGLFDEDLSRIYNCPIKTVISSRLDKGVSACDFGINFIAPERDFSLSYLAYYLKRTLSNDIFIKEVKEVKEDFSARHSAAYKTYTYLIQADEKRNPILTEITYQPHTKLNRKKLEEALSLFKGEHDFRYFAKPEKEDENTIFTISKTQLLKKRGIYYLSFTGKSFLRYEVRFLVGACLRYEQGRLTIEQIKRLLSGENIPYQKLRAEPQALFLNSIFYPDLDTEDKFNDPLSNLLK